MLVPLRFYTAVGSGTSPVKLRFQDNSVPEMPIGSPTVWASYGFFHDTKAPIATSVNCEWVNPVPLAQCALQLWKTQWVSLVSNDFPVRWGLTQLVTNSIRSCFKVSPKLHEKKMPIDWQVLQIIGNQSSFFYDQNPSLSTRNSMMVWSGNTFLGVSQFVNRWLKKSLSLTQFTGHYNDIDATRQPYFLNYGPTPSRWVCTSDYRPQKGRQKIRFGDNANLHKGAITIKFSASPVVCIYLPGGGYKANVPKTPVIDSKLPIEPQVQRAYVMQPTIECVRVKDNLRIVINAFSASHNRGQFAMTLSCEFSSRIDMQRTKNELLKWTINGYEFYGYIEQYTKRTVFGDETHSGTGRSRSAESASPYLNQISYTNMVNRSFAGILQELLQFTDWTVQLLGVPDFNVPARAFSASGKPPIEAVNDAIGQLGCMMICDDKNRRIKVVPRWPVVPWLTGVAQPDIVVHDAVIQEQSEADRISPLFDCVFARGEQLGVSAKVRRSGTAGDKPGADITSNLIVDVQAARLAGTAAIADSGKKRIWQLTLPVMASLPPFTIGQLIGVRVGADVFKATCDSFSLRASIDSNGAIDITQSVGLIESLE